jgi:VCBS repeat-containing protein
MAKAPTISAGPASGNDRFSATQDQAAAGTLLIDVLSNDAKKSTLYSIDNADVADLLTQDSVLTPNQSRLGASIWITANGQIGYALDSARAQSLAAGETFQDSFVYAVRLTSGSLVWQSVQVTITGTNDAPVATADVATVAEDAVATGSVALNDSDVDHGAVLKFATAGQLPAGFAMATDGTWVLDGSNPAYQSLAAGETQQLTVAYTVTDEHGARSSSTLTLTVRGTNDAPQVSGPVSGNASESGAAVTLDALAQASDADGGATLSVVNLPSAEDLPAGVTYDAGTHSFTLDPAAYQELAEGQTITVAVTYGVSDGSATTPASVAWTVTGVNGAPLVEAGFAEVTEDRIVSGQVTAIDFDIGAELTFAADNVSGFSMAADGNWTFDASDAAYQSLGEGEVMEIVVPYTVTDQHGAVGGSSMTITITGSNDAPEVTGIVSAEANEDSAPVTLDGLANSSDVDANSLLTIVDVPAAEDLPGGVTYDGATGTFTLDPADAAYQRLSAGETITVSVSYGVSDGIATTPAAVSWTVTGTNDVPVAEGAFDAIAEDRIVSGQLPGTDADSGATLTFLAESPPGFTMTEHGSWVFDSSDAAYQSLGEGEVMDVVVSYSVTDEHGASASSTLTLTVTGSNDAPQVTAVASAETTEDSSAVTLDALANASDPDTTSILSIVDVPSAEDLPAGVTYDAAWRTFTLDPAHPAYQQLAAGQTVVVSVGYGVFDGISTTPASVSWTVNGTNDVPVAEPAFDAITEDQVISGQLPATDADSGATLTYWLLDEGPWGFTLNPDGSWTFDASGQIYQPAAEGQSGEWVIRYAVSDEQGEATESTLTVTLSGANDAPMTENSGASLVEGSTASGQLVAYDFDEGAQLTFALAGDPLPGFTLNADGSWTLDASGPLYQELAEGQTGVLQIDYVVTDEFGASTTGVLGLEIAGINSAPVLVGPPDPLPDGNEDTAYVVTQQQLLSGWADPERGALAAINLAATNAAVTANADGSFTITPAADFSGVVQLTYEVTDGIAASPAETQLAIAAAPYVYTPPPISTAADPNDFDALHSNLAKTSTLFNFVATGASEVIEGSNGNDYVRGQGGSDVIYGHGGNDRLLGELDPGSSTQPPADGVPGNDTIYGQAGNDTLAGGQGSDTLYGGSGADELYGNVTLSGFNPETTGNTLYGGSGNDRLYGDAGNDVLVGGTGLDWLTGGAGADRFVFTSAADTGDWVFDFQAGVDKVDLSAFGLDPAKFVGSLSSAGMVGAGQVGFQVVQGATQKETYLYVDTDGQFGADLEIRLIGTNGINSSDIQWG